MFSFTDNNILTSAQLNGNFNATLDKTISSAQTVVGPTTFSGNLTSSGITTLTGAHVSGVSVMTGTGNYAVTTTDRFVLINKTTGSATQVTLPTPVSQGRLLTIKDAKGDCATNNITIVRSGTDLIDGATSITLNVNYASLDLVYSGSGWAIV